VCHRLPGLCPFCRDRQAECQTRMLVETSVQLILEPMCEVANTCT
jgi:hypothetical protein